MKVRSGRTDLLDDAGAVYGYVVCSLENIASSIVWLDERYTLQEAAGQLMEKKSAARASTGHIIQ